MSSGIENEFITAMPESCREFEPEIGLVLGSGLGSFAEKVDIHKTVPFGEIDGLPKSSVPGHAGQFLFATLGGKRLVIAQGRVHLYEGYSGWEVSAGIRLMAAMGISKLILTNAAGCANTDFAVGSWMAISDHLNLSGRTPLLGGPHFYDMSSVYSPAMRSHFHKVAEEEGINLFEGVYACMLGPQYETPAEVRMARTMGADAVGMSTVPEAIMAKALDLEISAFSCLTNWGAGITNEALHHGEVVDVGKIAAGQLVQILQKGLTSLK